MALVPDPTVTRRLRKLLLATAPPVAAETAAAGSQSPSDWVYSAFADEAGSSLDEQLSALAAAGMSHIDLRSVDGYNITALPYEHARVVAARLKEAGVSVCMFGSPIGKMDVADPLDEDMQKLEHLGKLKPLFFGGEGQFAEAKVRMFSYYNKKNALPDEDFKELVLERLSALKSRAKELGLQLYHENEGGIFGERLENTLLLLKALRDGETFFGIFDFSNFNQAGDDAWTNWEALQAYRGVAVLGGTGYIDALHLKDSDGAGQHTPLGLGAGSCKRILADCVKRGWDGPVTLEPHLKNSKAVLATGPSGRANESLEHLSAADVFHVAAEAAKSCMAEAGASWQ